MRHFDLCIIGSGSGNSIPDERFADHDIAIVDKGVYGGTCLNVGCIPTKMFVYPADLAHSPDVADRLGVELNFNKVRWTEIRDRIFGRIDPISAAGEAWRRQSQNITLYRESAHFVGPKTLDTGSAGLITADRIVIAAGSRPIIPDIEGIDSVTVHTSDTVMRLDQLPESVIILGGGFIAAEFGHIFSAYGVQVSIINRSGALLRQEDRDVSARFTELMSKRVDVRLNTVVARMERRPFDRVAVTITDAAGGTETLEADVLLAAVGRTPNSDTLNLGSTGVDVDAEGYVAVDCYQRTSVDGIFAVGDVSSRLQLKHVANHEMRVVQHNLLHPTEMIESDHRFVPHAVFSEPQVASVGLTEQQAKEAGIRYVTSIQDYGSVAYGWAMEDTDHFAKLLADPVTGMLLGAHLIGPQASSLIQPLIQAMSFGQSAHEVARGQYWIHPAMAELVENALLALPLD
ncbi:MAG: NADPH-dependent mycothiol reductase Mtr [uncultured Propionibacteriaceae bacterium]|uniref:NADPH-dependent mycothiol reductase Mtr n=1 Tax=uncultured Propionibacteriaceae bacterium TaxID=257457 RepID=A0A6J4NH57_9ACTN|nr:MAG: NADPH-dependent mycothiol reductase Mtr [uncultured Propionibacteriaceae bacterium]